MTPRVIYKVHPEVRFKDRLTSGAAVDVGHPGMALERTQRSSPGMLASATSPPLGREAGEHPRLTTPPEVSFNRLHTASEAAGDQT